MATAVLQYTADIVPPTGASLTGVPMQTVNVPTSSSSAKSFSVTRKIDASSPKLFQLCAQGKHINKIVLTARKSGGSKTYYTVTLTNCTVSGYSRSASTETISMTFGQMESNLPATVGALV